MKIIKILINVSIFFITFLIVCLVLEGFLRLRDKEIPERVNGLDRFCEYHEVLGWKGIPFKQGQFQTEGSLSHIELNSRGFRDRDHGDVAPAGKKRILLLGDSFAWGYGVEFSDIFFEVLQQDSNRYEFINTGHCGYGSDQHILMLKMVADDYSPDAVVLMFVLNDFAYLTQSSAYGYAKPYFRLSDKGLELKNNPVPKTEKEISSDKGPKKEKFNRKYLYKHSLLFKLFEDSREDLQYRLGMKDANEFFKEDHVKWLLGKKILGEIKLFCDREGMELVLCIIPNKLQLYTFYDAGDPQRMIEKFCRDHGIPCLDMLENFRSRDKKLYFDYDPHWNKEGHLLASELLGAFLDKEL